MIPCRSVDSILSDYTRVAMDHLPYCFFMTTKTLVFASSHVSDKPMQTIKLNARNGSKMYKLVSIKTKTQHHLETSYNLDLDVTLTSYSLDSMFKF